MVLPQGRAVGEMLTSRDGLPYSAFRFLNASIFSFNIIILVVVMIITIAMIIIIDQVSPVCIAACGGFTLVKASSCYYSWVGRNKKCKVSE